MEFMKHMKSSTTFREKFFQLINFLLNYIKYVLSILQGITTRIPDEYSSTLVIESLSSAHNGKRINFIGTLLLLLTPFGKISIVSNETGD